MLSKSHAKYIQSLHQKKFRDQENCFIAEGGKIIMELLATNKFACKEILGTAEWLNPMESSIRKHFSGPLLSIEIHELEKIAALTTPNQVMAIFQKVEAKPVKASGKLCLMLDHLQDPGNLGTIIRTADWFGISDIICSPGCADIYNPKVVQSTMGSLGRVNIYYGELVDWIQQQKEVKLYATALNGKNVKTMKITEGLIVIGNESKGISEEIMNLATEKITIPKTGQAESLNAAVAAGIILSHII